MFVYILAQNSTDWKLIDWWNVIVYREQWYSAEEGHVCNSVRNITPISVLATMFSAYAQGSKVCIYVSSEFVGALCSDNSDHKQGVYERQNVQWTIQIKPVRISHLRDCGNSSSTVSSASSLSALIIPLLIIKDLRFDQYRCWGL